MDLANYTITEQLHQSTRFVTYKATRTQDNTPVVLRMLKSPYPSDFDIKRIRQEYNLLNAIHAPNLVRYLSMERYGSQWMIVREMAQGTSLQAYLQQNRPDLSQFFDLAFQLATALKELHSHKVLHKKISSSNIIIDPATLEVKLAGFSLATAMTREAIKPAAVDIYEAELAYISPEQTGRLNRTIDYRTDYYSLGVVLYQMLTGHLPFEMEDPMEVVHSQIARQPVPPHYLRPDAPVCVSEVIMKLLAKEDDDRYQSIDGLLFDLAQCRRAANGLQQASFSLGTSDVSDKFRISGKLYGREEEIRQLLQTFYRVRNGDAEVLVVEGYSGVGKSRLVGMVQKLMTEYNGFFISGKFDQFKGDAPMSAPLMAFRSLLQQLLRESENKIAVWRQDVLQAVGVHGKLLTDVIPELELLIGPQPPVQELPPLEANSRFFEVFGRFIGVFAKPENPLCLFLDDLQWLDSATRQWIEMQLSTQRLKHLLLIVAYRNNEVSESHPVKMMLDRLYKARIPLTIILLEPLNIHHLTQLIADTLLSDPENCAPLAEVIFKKTNGNPFFTRQCLLSLYESGALFFDPELKRWSYALQKVQEVQISDNVVELMVQLIEKLSGPEQNTLKLAACIGNQFSLQTLFRVSTQSADELSSHISALLRHGLLVPFYTWGEAGAEMYAFLHDRVQQAAMSLLGEEEKQEVRLQIGRLLLQQEESLEKGKNIYLIADHLNYAKSLITDKEERQKLAELNLAACQRARKATAYELGKRYIVQAMEILPEELWQQPLPFIAEVYLQRAECEHLCGNDTIAEEFYNLAISQPSDSLGKARLYQRKIHYYTNLRKFDEAYQTGREAVALLGVSLPQRFVPPLFVKDLIQFRLLLGSKKIPELINLPEMTNERMKMAILLMSTFARAAYQIRPELCVAVCTRMATICLRYGNTEGGFVGFMALGSIFLGAVLKQRQIGYDFGRLTLALVEKYKSLGFKAETYFVVGYFAIPWRDPAVEMERFWQIAYEAGLQSGDHFHASCACCGTIQSFYMRGVSFKETEVAINRYKDFLQRINNEEGLLTLQAVQQAIRNLSGQTASPLSFDDDAFDENRYVQKLATFASRHFAHYYFINKMQTLYLRGEYEKALAVSEQSDAYLKDSPGMMHTAEHFFYKGLILAARLQQTNESPFSKQARKLTTLARKLISYAAGCPDNFLHKSLLLQAEIKRYRNDTVSAERLYNEAIEMAVKYGYTNVQALANVRLGQLYLAIDRKKLAGFYLQEAVYAYITWGATAIAALLAKQYPGLVSSANKGPGNHFAIGANGQLAIQREGTDRLDLETVLKSSQAISSEIQLNNLLSTLMKIILENAGADRMVLLLEKDNALLVKAERRAGDDRSEMLDDIPLHTYESMARSVVNYVMRTHQPVILENASESDEFGNDDYFRQHQTKSVLCTALVQQGKLTGIIYLENNLTGAAFTRERIDLVLLLSGQMAISINNALLYENLEEKVKDRTRALKEEMDRSDNLLLNILPAETAEELKRTGSSKAKVFQRATVLFTDFKNFTLLSERLSAEELVGEINYCYSTFDQIISKYGIEKIKTIGDSYMCAGGLPVESETNPVDTLMAALEIRDFMLEELQKRKEKGQPFFEIRIGLHTGSVVAGIVGIKKFAYDIWGDTVNIASRMESSGEPGKVNISADTYELIKDKFTCSHRGKIQAKNKGSIDMYFVDCPKEQEMPEPAETF